MGSKHLPRVEEPMDTSDVQLGHRGWALSVFMGTQGAEEPMDNSNVLLRGPGVGERWAANIYQGLRDPWKPQGFFWGDQELSTQHRYGDPRG